MYNSSPKSSPQGSMKVRRLPAHRTNLFISMSPIICLRAEVSKAENLLPITEARGIAATHLENEQRNIKIHYFIEEGKVK